MWPQAWSGSYKEGEVHRRQGCSHRPKPAHDLTRTTVPSTRWHDPHRRSRRTHTIRQTQSYWESRARASAIPTAASVALPPLFHSWGQHLAGGGVVTTAALTVPMPWAAPLISMWPHDEVYGHHHPHCTPPHHSAPPFTSFRVRGIVSAVCPQLRMDSEWCIVSCGEGYDKSCSTFSFSTISFCYRANAACRSRLQLPFVTLTLP
jgi:hypothetical protein